jgi:hypothetical protein
MARRGKAGSELGLALPAVTLLFFGSSEADAAYRLTFQNGTSVEVRSYEDLGDSIRLTGVGLFVALVGIVAFFVSNTWAGPGVFPPGQSAIRGQSSCGGGSVRR